jgi:hypothetical protein
VHAVGDLGGALAASAFLPVDVVVGASIHVALHAIIDLAALEEGRRADVVLFERKVAALRAQRSLRPDLDLKRGEEINFY